jgi:transposase-like protein
VNHFGPKIAADLRRRRPKPHTIWHLDEVFLKIAGRKVYLWRAVDAEGEVLDVLVQAKRDKNAALNLMRRLLKKHGFVPRQLITDDLRSYSAAAHDLGIENRLSAVGGETIEPRTHTSRLDEGNARCNASRAWLCPAISLQSRRPLQHLQRPTPSDISSNAPRLPCVGDEHLVRGCRDHLKICEK